MHGITVCTPAQNAIDLPQQTNKHPQQASTRRSKQQQNNNASGRSRNSGAVECRVQRQRGRRRQSESCHVLHARAWTHTPSCVSHSPRAVVLLLQQPHGEGKKVLVPEALPAGGGPLVGHPTSAKGTPVAAAPAGDSSTTPPLTPRSAAPLQPQAATHTLPMSAQPLAGSTATRVQPVSPESNLYSIRAPVSPTAAGSASPGHQHRHKK